MCKLCMLIDIAISKRWRIDYSYIQYRYIYTHAHAVLLQLSFIQLVCSDRLCSIYLHNHHYIWQYSHSTVYHHIRYHQKTSSDLRDAQQMCYHGRDGCTSFGNTPDISKMHSIMKYDYTIAKGFSQLLFSTIVMHV